MKSWITNGIRTSIKRSEKLYKNKDIQDGYHRQYKEVRNKIVNLCKPNKKIYFQNSFLQNANNIKQTWRGIKSIIIIITKIEVSQHLLCTNNRT